ncbi:MAG: DUF4111 domain-containing protein [Proteobacteria bacterium]|nr:DUF4111 domain-containing protein [Pseudomonadota bacterium]
MENLSLKESDYQAYLVVILCRILFLHLNDRVASKQEASNWVKNTYPKWASLIENAENWKEHHKPNICDNEILGFISFLKGIIF